MKKFFAFVAVALVAFGFTACNNEPVIKIDITETTEFTDAVASQGWWQLQAENDEYYVTLSNAGTVTAVPGTYQVADLDPEYSFIGIIKTETILELKDGSVKVSVAADGTVTADGKFKASDENTYKLHIVAAPKAPVNLTFAIAETADGITVTPSNDEDAWDYAILSAETFASIDNDADYVAAYMFSQYGAEYAAAGAYTFAWDGDEIPYYCETAGNYVLIVWGADNSGVTTAAVAYTFAYEGAATAPAKVAAKALKSNKIQAIPTYIKRATRK